MLNGDPKHSDHRPIIISTELRENAVVKMNKAFYFEVGWLEEERCEEVVKEGW